MESDRILYGPDRISSKLPLSIAAMDAVAAASDDELSLLHDLYATLEGEQHREWVTAGQISSGSDVGRRPLEQTEQLLQRLTDKGLVAMQHGEGMPDLWRLSSFGTTVCTATDLKGTQTKNEAARPITGG